MSRSRALGGLVQPGHWCILPIVSCSLLAMILVCTAASATEPAANEELAAARFPATVTRFFSTYCVSCHGPDKSESDLRLDTMSHDLVGGPHADDWHDVLDALNLGEMPPKEAKQPGEDEREEVIELLTDAFEKAAAARRSTGGKVVMRRLTKYEYNNTLNELLSMDEDFSKDFPPDSVSEDGFKNNGMYMAMSSLQLRQYIETARYALDAAIHEGEQPELLTAALGDVTALSFDTAKTHVDQYTGLDSRPIKTKSTAGSTGGVIPSTEQSSSTPR